MSNLTDCVDDEQIQPARIKSVEQEISVRDKVRESLGSRSADTKTSIPAAPITPSVFNGTHGLQQCINPLSNKSLLQAAEE